jgi:hypothetical protein
LRQFSTCFWLSTGTPSQFRNLAVHNIELSCAAESDLWNPGRLHLGERYCILGVSSNDLLSSPGFHFCSIGWTSPLWYFKPVARTLRGY